MAAENAASSALARYMEQRVRSTPVLELLPAAVPNAVCFRYRCDDAERANVHLAVALRECGFLAASETRIDAQPAIRAAMEDCASTADIDALVNAAIVLGAIAANGKPVPAAITANLSPLGLPAYIGFAGLWRLVLAGMEISRLGPLLEAHLARNPDDAAVMMDIATLIILTMIPEYRAAAFAMQARALDIQQLYRLPAAREGAGIRVLALAAPGDMTAITHLDCLLEGSDVELLVLYARPDRPLPSRLPDHDLVFVTAGESVPNRPLLKQIESFTNASPKPVLNAPDRILRLSRDSVSALLRPVPGIVMPMTAGVSRESLERVGRGELPLAALLEDGVFPIIARPLDSQGGKDLAKLDGPAAIADYLRTAAEGEFFISRFVDYNGLDGLFRKYRVVLIAGRPYACHMGISTHWMIHYVNADMDASAAKRDEEARFMADFDSGFALRHKDSLARIDALLGLDYYGIDCAETPDGRLLVFEVDTAMLVHAMDPPDLYPYKRPQMRKLFGAFRSMLAAAVERVGQRK